MHSNTRLHRYCGIFSHTAQSLTRNLGLYWCRNTDVGDKPKYIECSSKIVRRKKWESLTDLAQEIRLLMVRAFPGPTDRTTDIVARDVFIEV